MKSVLNIIALILISAVNSAACAQEPAWGSLRARFVLSGPLPEPQVLQIERDAEVCGNVGLVDESLVINSQNRGIRNLIVWLEAKSPVPIHPQRQAQQPALLDNRGCRFEPRVLCLQTGQPLQLLNNDPVVHNAAAFLRRSTPFNEVIPAGKPSERIIRKAETLPVRVDCSIHSWMKAWLVVLDHPYAAVSDADGRVELPLLPAGEWRFRFWHERPENISGWIRGNTPETLDRGGLLLTIPAGDTLDLGELQLTTAELTVKKKK
jgi:hypothetical protein